MEEKQIISYRVAFDENSGGNSEENSQENFNNWKTETHWEPSFRSAGRFEKLKLVLAGGFGLLILLTVLLTFLFVGLVLSVPVILLGLYWYWRVGKNFRRHFGPSGL